MKKISELINEAGVKHPLSLSTCHANIKGKNRVNILALGDVGTTMLIGLRLLGSDVISEIGICDIKAENCERLEREINQISYPFEMQPLPPVKIIGEDRLFDCDVMIFCASKGVPPVVKSSKASEPLDVRMAQLEANRELIKHFASLASENNYKGMIVVVSDPVDNLCAAFMDEMLASGSDLSSGFSASMFHGCGLGVMNARALYYSEKNPRFSSFTTEGRSYGPHGKNLVIANSIDNYDDSLSRELTELASNANIEIRNLGFKPYIAPAISSAAISIILMLRGEWHYGSIYFGDASHGAFLGIKCRLTDKGWEYEDIDLPQKLYERISYAYIDLCNIR